MGRYFFYSMYAFLLVAGLFSCKSPSKNSFNSAISQSLKINIQGEPQTLDPRKARSLSDQNLLRMLFEGLTRFNQEEKAELALAEQVTVSSDLKTYTFSLKDSTWSNGDPVLASDFAYAWRKILSPDFPSDLASMLYVIRNAKAVKEGKIPLEDLGIKVLNDKTLFIELENPTPYFLDLVASPNFFPIHQKIDEKNPSWSQHSETYVSNGPFLLKEWKHHDRIFVLKNERYWDRATVKLNSLELPMLQEETELKCFEKNELDWAGSPLSTLPVDALKFLRKKKQLKTKDLLGTYFIRVNTKAFPFDHPAIRKAFALAINRQEIITHITQGNQIPATGLVPPSLKLQRYPYFKDGDVAKARYLFKEAMQAQHINKEDLPEIIFTYRNSERNHLIAQAIQQQWFDTFGVWVKLEAVEGKVYLDRISKQDYQLSSGSWIADFADPINFLEVFKYQNSGSNNTLWENQRYAALLDQSNHIADPQQRIELLAQSEQILIEQMPIIPIFYYTMLYVHRMTLKDVVLSSAGQIDFKWASIEKQGERM